MFIKNGLWWCVHIWGWGGTCKVGHKWFWNGIHKQLCKGDTAEDEGLRDHYLHLQRERTGQGHVQLIPSVAVTETCGSLVNRAYRVLQAEVLQNWKYHSPLRCCSYWIKLHNKLGFFFLIIPWLLNTIMPNSKSRMNMKPVNLWKFFSHKEMPRAVLYPKQPNDIKTSHQHSVQYQCFFNILSSSQ